MAIDSGYWECAKDTNVPTNGDYIRAMSDEELGRYLLGISTTECPFENDRCNRKTCTECWEDWLKEPIDEHHKHFPHGECT